MGSAASVESEEGVTKDKCKLILGPNFDEARFNSLQDAAGCISKKQLEEEIAKFESKPSNKLDRPGASLSKKEQWKSSRNMNLVIAQDDRDLCKEMFGSLYSDALFDSMADVNGCISKEQMMVELAKLKASGQGGGDEALSPASAAALFSSKLHTGIAVSCELRQLKGLFGRVMQSTDVADFQQLRGHSSTLFPFVIDHRGLHGLLQCSDGWAMMLKLGWTEAGLKKKAAMTNIAFKLVIFPSDAVTPEPVLATWSAIVSLAAELFPAVGPRLQAHLEALKTTPLDIIDPDGKLDTCEGLTAESYAASEDSLFNARLFLRTQCDLSSPFRGNGQLADGTEEFVVKNVAISAITDAQVIEVVVTPPPQV